MFLRTIFLRRPQASSDSQGVSGGKIRFRNSEEERLVYGQRLEKRSSEARTAKARQMWPPLQ